MFMMVGLFSGKEQVYCAFCKNTNRVYKSKRVGVLHILAILLFTLVLMFGLWQTVEPRAILIFLSLLAVTEIFVHLRWRISLVCRHCGFDPLVYKKNPEVAAQRVKSFIENRAQNPRFLLAPSLNLPKIRAKTPSLNGQQATPAMAVQKSKGKIISRTV